MTCALATQPLHGTLTGTPPNLTYTPAAGYQGMDRFTFTAPDSLTTSSPATVHMVVGSGGTGLNGSYYDNMDFTSLKATQIDPSVNFAAGSPASGTSLNFAMPQTYIITSQDGSTKTYNVTTVPICFR